MRNLSQGEKSILLVEYEQRTGLDPESELSGDAARWFRHKLKEQALKTDKDYWRLRCEIAEAAHRAVRPHGIGIRAPSTGYYDPAEGNPPPIGGAL